MLDMDEPHEVIAAAAGFAGAIDTTGKLVRQVNKQLVLPHQPGSALDQRLADQLSWIRRTFAGAVTAGGGRAQLTLEQTAAAAIAIGAADTAGGASIRRTAAG